MPFRATMSMIIKKLKGIFPKSASRFNLLKTKDRAARTCAGGLRTDVCHDITDNQDTYASYRDFFRNLKSLKISNLAIFQESWVRQKAILKKPKRSLNVIENKGARIS